MELRPYQKEALDAIHREFERCRSTLLVLPTGTGKTVVFAHLLRHEFHGRVMVLAHRGELLYQAADKIERVSGHDTSLEAGKFWAPEEYCEKTRVVTAMFQTMTNGRMTRFDPKEFDYLIVDEAHHSVSPTFRRVAEYFLNGNPSLKMLGVTATPDRFDNKSLGQMFDSVAYTYTMPDAIRDGWLTPVKQGVARVKELDFSLAKSYKGDFSNKSINEIMMAEEVPQGIASSIIQYSEDRQTLVFATSVSNAALLAEILNRHRHGCAEWLSGKTPQEERADILKRHADHEFQYLVNVGVLTEGYDDPGITMIVMARPTKSRALYAQMLGRGCRPLPGLVDQYDTAEERRAAIRESAKPEVLVLDFTDNTYKHDLVSAVDILAGDMDPIRVKRAKEKSRKKTADVFELLQEAEEELEEEEKERLEKLRQERAEALRVVRANAKCVVRWVDSPFKALGVRRPAQTLKRDVPTPNQIKYLARVGVPDVHKLSRAEANKLCRVLGWRRKMGWCEYRLAAELEAMGLDSKVTTEAALMMKRQRERELLKRAQDEYENLCG